MTPFRRRLAAAVGEHGPLCVGIDPHPALLDQWGLTDDAAGVEAFARGVVAALAGHAAVVKPQVALFEVHGPAGLEALARTLADAREAGLLTLADAKRGDIGSTMAAYARAWLSDDSRLAADALTVSPYLGVGALAPAFDLAEATGRGVFVLARTSNPEAVGLQSAGSPSVAQAVVDAAAQRNAAGSAGALGVVVGATRGTAGRDHDLDLAALGGPVLVPGLGAQGATPDDVRAAFPGMAGGSGGTATAAAGPIVPVSAREVLATGPDHEALRAAVGALNGSLAG